MLYLARTDHINAYDFLFLLPPSPSKSTFQGLAGTLPYMAPEMIKGVAYTKAVDMWSIGEAKTVM